MLRFRNRHISLTQQCVLVANLLVSHLRGQLLFILRWVKNLD